MTADPRALLAIADGLLSIVFVLVMLRIGRARRELAALHQPCAPDPDMVQLAEWSDQIADRRRPR